ncbi:alkaline phosphatase family protein [Halobaculum sp. CBA1158]|uniref:alkaline phosphatase family protein n=1 Tax=Halobaculum sp. CBA1158 TaxID=2904243 RepID=UPI001F22971D|nr:alkaline phosphatase family protein [Halobaculum sp. CBA1158]UIP01069.1 alkaline phosphatase family protein [Halobaculum sp. CBA1158]
MLLVLALDALDHEHVSRFDVPALELEQARPIETFSYMKDQPYTLEVWPTVATGLGPEEHGLTGGGTSEWDNSAVNFVSKFTSKLGGNTRDKLGSLAESVTGATYSIPETDSEHVFQGEGRVVHNWPGVHNSAELKRVWDTANPDEGDQTIGGFEREIYGIGAEQFGWTREMLNHELSLVGCHIHTLDMCGHIYRHDEARYRKTYQRVNDWVAEVRDRLGDDDELLLLSDHGIHTSWDSSSVEPGRHAERAMAATTMSTDLFDDVRHAREWIEAAVSDVDISRQEVDMPTDQLEDLGYI